PVKVRYEAIIRALLGWFQKLYPPSGAADFVLDAAETALALVPQSLLDKTPRAEQDESEKDDEDDEEDDDAAEWRENTPFVRWLEQAQASRKMPGWTSAHDVRLFRLCRWLDEPVPGARRKRPDLAILLAAYAAGSAPLADFHD